MRLTLAVLAVAAGQPVTGAGLITGLTVLDAVDPELPAATVTVRRVHPRRPARHAGRPGHNVETLQFAEASHVYSV